VSALAQPQVNVTTSNPATSSTAAWANFDQSSATQVLNEVTINDLSGTAPNVVIDFDGGGSSPNRQLSQCGLLKETVSSADDARALIGEILVNTLPADVWCGVGFMSPSGPGTWAVGCGIVDDGGTRKRKTHTGTAAGTPATEAGCVRVRVIAHINGSDDISQVSFLFLDAAGATLEATEQDVAYDLSSGADFYVAFGEHNDPGAAVTGLDLDAGHYVLAELPAL